MKINLLYLFLLAPTLLFAQKELKKYDRAVYAGIGYTKLGFGEVNQALLTKKQAQKLNRRIQRIQTDYGAVIIFVSFITEEVNDWENGGLGGLPRHFLGEDPRAERNHIIILFSEVDGKNWIEYGSDNESLFKDHTKTLSQLFTSKYRRANAYRPIRHLLKSIDRMYAQLDTKRKNAFLHPQLSVSEWIHLSRAEMDITQAYSAAAQHLHNALKLDAANAEAQMLLGYAYMELQDWNAAAAAFATSWSLSPDFETALGKLTLHFSRNEPAEVKKWTERVRQFSPDFEERVYEVAHYGNQGNFLGNMAQIVFNKQFQQEIQRSKLEKKPEADAY